MLSKTEGIVIHSVNYSDSSLIANIYTRDFGKQAFIINGVRKKRSKISMNYFQPLTLLDLEAYFKQSREIQRIKEIRLLYPYISIPTDIRKNTIALFLSEILYKTLKEEEKNTLLFDFLSQSLKIFDLQNEGISNFHIIFLLKFSKYLGIFPENHLEINTFVKSHTSYILQDLLDYSFENLQQIEFNSKTRNELLSYLVMYYRNHLEGMGEVKSLAVLQEVFAE